MYEQQILALVKKAAPQNPIAYMNEIIKDYTAENLSRVMLGCRESGQDDFRTTWNGNVRADIVIINDRPRGDSIYSLEGTNEMDLIQRAFSGMGYEGDLFFIDAVNFNTYKSADGNIIPRTPTREEVDSCQVFINHAIETVRPKVVLLLGAIASNVYLREPFIKVRGEWIVAHGVPAIATHHPTKLLNEDGMFDDETVADMKEEFLDDIEKILTKIQS